MAEDALEQNGLSPTPLEQWEGAFTAGKTLRLSSHRVCVAHRLNLGPEMLEGVVPNLVLQHVMFGEELEVAPEDPSEKVAEILKALYYIAAKCLIYPKLVIERAPIPEHMEIGPAGLTPQDASELARWSLWGQLPEVEDAPFRVDHTEGPGIEGHESTEPPDWEGSLGDRLREEEAEISEDG